jgi:hypothetical protein
MTINIKLGSDFNATYLVAATTAPKAYDGFGTIDLGGPITLGDNHEARIVLVREEHAQWQRSRYGSGGHCCSEDAVSYLDEATVVEELYKRLSGQVDPT